MIPVWLAAKLLPVRKVLSRIPTWAWIALAVALVAFAGWRWHVGEVRHADRQGYARGVERTQAAYRKALADARIIAGRRRAAQEATARRINEELTNERDRALARLRGAAVRLLEQGPGAAACPGRIDRPGVPGGSAGAGNRATGSAAVAPVPPGEGQQLAGLPWAPTVALGWNHDALRTYYLLDRRWHQEHEAAWTKWRSEKR